jgi:hypothetical protein
MIRSAHRGCGWGWLFMMAFLTASPAVAQRINFGAYATTDISLTLSGNLNFNDKQPAIGSGSNTTVTIALTDNETQYLTITGDATRDVTITVTSPAVLMTNGGGPGNEIPFTCQFAYSNLGASTVSSAKAVAVQVPGGFTAVTIPLLRRTSGAPLPPPTPAHGGYTAPSATAYLFLYGSLGPVGNVSAGAYSGTVNVNVQY